MARALAVNGAARVYLLGRRLEPLQKAAQEFPHIFTPLQCDVTQAASLRAVVDTIVSASGYINLLVANAGAGGPPAGWSPTLPLSEISASLFRQDVMDATNDALAVNTTGAFFTIVAFLELLDAGNKNALNGGFGKPCQRGSDVPAVQSQVVVTSSIAAYSRMHMSSPAYAASKAAILHLTKQASTNLARFGIRANALAPGCKFLFVERLRTGG
jgi:NAD(P)-dependent dehydrogenase (short-subunit alcohol dehydrogenase family)